LIIENEKIKIIKSFNVGGISGMGYESLAEIGKDQLAKDKLIIELGKEGANTVLKFLDEITSF
jgi:hypothetical protein